MRFHFGTTMRFHFRITMHWLGKYQIRSSIRRGRRLEGSNLVSFWLRGGKILEIEGQY